MKNNRILILGAGMCLVLAMFVGCGGRSGEKEYNKAMKAWQKGDLVQARTLFEKSTGRLSGNEKKSLAYNNLGLVLWQLGEPKDAASAFNDSCTLSDSITAANLNQAVALFHSGDFDGARMSINMYLGENPKDKTALAMQGLIAAKKQDWAQSARLIAEAVANDPNDPAAQNALALAELNHGQNSAQAVARLKKISAAHPGYAPAIYNLGVIHDQWLRDKASAVQYYQRYLQKTGANASHSAAAQAAMDRLTGQASGEPASADSAAATQYMAEGARLHGEKRYAEAVSQFKNAIQADPSQKKAYYNLGLSNFFLAHYTNAQQAFKEALSIDPRYADALYMLSYSYFQQKKWNDAEREAKELEKVDPKRGGDMLKHIANARK